MDKISIYQIFTRLFGNKNNAPIPHGDYTSNGVGKMNDITDKALKEIKDLGITHVWYTGIIEHATCMEYPDYGIKGQHPSTVKGRAGSPYAISDYWDVNPYLAEQVNERMHEFEALVKRTHANHLKVIVDFVPNHVARQYGSDIYPDKDFGLKDNNHMAFLPSNNFYYIPGEPLHYNPDMGTLLETDKVGTYIEFPAKVTGNDQFHAYPSINDWYETVKLNYGIDYKGGGTPYFDPIPPLWEQMVELLLFWAAKDIDAFRCDMVEMVPVAFWNYAITKVKQEFPSILFIAEVYNPHQYKDYIMNGGFDYLYDKVGLYDTLRNIINNRASASEITQCWQRLDGLDAKMLRFLENHDEHRLASRFFCSDPQKGIPAMLVCATLNTGPVMTYFGQEVGEPAMGASGYSGDDGKTTIFDFWNVPEHQKWMNSGNFDGALLSNLQLELRKNYKEILNLSLSEKAIGKGKFYDLMWVNHFEGGPDHRFIYAYLRYFENEFLLLVTNFNNQSEQQFRLKIPEHAFSEMDIKATKGLELTCIYGQGESEKIDLLNVAYKGFYIRLDPNSAVVYKCKQNV
jgi:glycosidase